MARTTIMAREDYNTVLTEEPSIESIYSALETLHGCSSSSIQNNDDNSIMINARRDASSFLTSIQSSIFGWKIADSLLSSKRDVHSTYFAAQTLKLKIKSNLKEDLPMIESRLSLRSTIIGHLNELVSKTSHQDEVKVIVTQLTLCLSFLYILDSDSWTDVVTTTSSSKIPWLLSVVEDVCLQVSLLTIIAEEVLDVSVSEEDQEGHHVRRKVKGLDNQRRKRLVNQDLKSVVNPVISFLTTLLLEGNTVKKSSIYRAFGVWSRMLFNDSDDDISKNLEASSSLLSSCLSTIKLSNQSESLDEEHDAASDAVTSLVTAYFCSKNLRETSRSLSSTSVEQQNIMICTTSLINSICSLESTFHACMQSESIDFGINVIRVMADSCDASLDFLINCVMLDNDSEIMTEMTLSLQRLLSCLINCIDSSFETEVAEASFCFFHHFFDAVFDVVSSSRVSSSTRHEQDNNNDYQEEEEVLSPQQSRLKSFATQVSQQLTLRVLKKHAQLEPDQESLLELDSDQREFRIRVSDLLRDSSFLMTASSTVNEIITRMTQEQQQQQQQNTSWTQIEVDLFFISSLAPELKREALDNEAVISRILSFILSQKRTTHPQILVNYCDIIAHFSEFLATSVSGQRFLEDVLTFLLNLIAVQDKSNAGVSAVASSSLQPIIGALFSAGSSSSSSRIPAESLLPLLIQVLDSKYSQENVNEEKDDGMIHALLESAANLVNALLDQENKGKVVQSILQPNLNLMLQKNTCSRELEEDPCVIFDRMSSFLRHLKYFDYGVTLTTFISSVLWPTIKCVLFKPNIKTRIMERTTRCLRFVIRSLRPNYLLEDISLAVNEVYKRDSSHSCLLYVASILVDEFLVNESDQTTQLLILLLNDMSLATFNFLTNAMTSSSSANQIREHPDTIDDFFRLCTR